MEKNTADRRTDWRTGNRPLNLTPLYEQVVLSHRHAQSASGHRNRLGFQALLCSGSQKRQHRLTEYEAKRLHDEGEDEVVGEKGVGKGRRDFG